MQEGDAPRALRLLRTRGERLGGGAAADKRDHIAPAQASDLHSTPPRARNACQNIELPAISQRPGEQKKIDCACAANVATWCAEVREAP